MAQRFSLPPPYGYHLHQKSFSDTNLAASRVETRAPRQPANQRLAPQSISAADYYPQPPRRTVYSHNNAIGVEITVLSNATRHTPVPSWWSDTSDDRFHPQLLNPSTMSQRIERHQETHAFYQNSGKGVNQALSPGSPKRHAPPSAPLPASRINNSPYNIEEPQRKGSVASGSSAYTGYNDGNSSPSSQEQAVPLPISDSKQSPLTRRLFVQNRTSVQMSDEVPLAEKSQGSTRPSRSQIIDRSSRPPPITTRNSSESPRQIPGSPRTHQPPAPGPDQSASYASVAAYMTTPHGVAFPTSPTALRAYPSPNTASMGAGFGPAPGSAAGLGSPRLNSSFPDYRKNQRSGTVYNDGHKSRQTGRGTVNYGQELTYSPPRSNIEAPSPGIASIPTPTRRQTRIKPVPTHACLTLNRMDRLKLVKFPQTAVFAVRTAIERSWVKGIQKEKDATGQTEIQFRGNPWSGQGDDACPALKMVCEVMASLYHLGWNLVMCTDISKRALDKDTLVYRLGDIPIPCTFMAVSFNEGDRLRLIKAPNDVINAVKNVWGGNIHRESWKLENVAWEFKLTGSPWWSSGDESLSVSILLLNMLDAMHALGWELHASVDITAGPGGLGKNAGADTDCWILRKVIA